MAGLKISGVACPNSSEILTSSRNHESIWRLHQRMKTIRENLLNCRGILVHGCNCQGVMGAGVAAAIRNRWPDVAQAYQNRYREKGLLLGGAVTVASTHNQTAWSSLELIDAWSPQLPAGVIVVNLLTQEFFGRDPNRVYVDYDALERGFRDIVRPLAHATGLPVFFPLIGCGLANGSWDVVEGRIERALHDVADKTLVVL
ncbi:MAG: macro domain-containing protein [Halomonas sp.]|nr:macro domain-containing protein [Halomonas sp.]MDM7481603.1 macro domain-containing protein [Halomonas sp.]